MSIVSDLTEANAAKFSGFSQQVNNTIKEVSAKTDNKLEQKAIATEQQQAQKTKQLVQTARAHPGNALARVDISA
ncbi:hypothetical protein ACQZV8_14465 [Magnetococcales bacterium HHB-1]